MTETRRLSSLRRRESGSVVKVSTDDSLLRTGLYEQGFTEGTDVEVLEIGAIGGTPMSIRVGRAIVALRRREADAIEVTAA